MGYTCSWATTGWILLKLAAFLIAAFLFSVIFWATQRWLDKCAKKKKKR